MKKTKIICTIGPTSEDEKILRQLISSGLNVTRLNFSHGDYKEHKKRIDTIKKVRTEMDLPIGIILDTKGPEIRTGKFKDSDVILEDGQIFTLTTRDIIGDSTIVGVSYKNLPKDLKVGDRVLIDDGLIALEVKEIANDTDIECIVKNGGSLSDHKGINVPGVKINLPAVTQKDVNDILLSLIHI